MIWFHQHITACKFELCTRLTCSTVVPPRLAKPVFSVPFERDDGFVGREDVIDDIKKLLKRKHRVCLSGLGGVGYSVFL
jgi:hypothetical protein